MLHTLISNLEALDNSLWAYICLPGILFLGAYFSFKTKFVQVRQFPHIIKTFYNYMKHHSGSDENGVHPLKTFFACVGGCIGIGNVVAICTAVQIGGPGALLWVWLTAIVGSILKYSEVYLGLRYRVANGSGGYQGGPMYFLKRVFKKSLIPNLVAILLCIYGVEIYQFGIVAKAITDNFGFEKIYVVLVLLALVIGISSGGVKRVGHFSSMLVPIFIVCYLSMGIWVLCANISVLPQVMGAVVSSAFTGHAAVGAFAGSSIMIAISQGIRRGCYSGDVGVGYASVIHSESREVKAERQASLAIFDVFLDTFMICTTSVLIVLVTGVWQEPIDASILIQTALSNHFPYMEYFMPFFLFLLGYTTITAYFCAGIKCAEYLSPRFGKILYFCYAALALFLFSFVETYQALIVMSVTGGLLLVVNLYGIYRLRHEISFRLTNLH